MTAPQAQIEAAESYERLFVPALFGEWAPRTVVAGGVGEGQRALDVACGTGVVVREVLRRRPQLVSGVDPNAGMVEIASRLAPGVDFRVAAAESLPFPNGFFDVALCQFGWMFFADRALALSELLRVLAPGGRFVVVVWDQIERAPAFAQLAALLERRIGQQAAAALHAPFALGDKRVLLETFASEHLPSLAITTHVGRARFPSVRSLVEAELRGWLPVMGVELSEHQVKQLLEEAEGLFRPLVGAEGELSFEMSAHLVTAARD
jgi:SAM-dependent methyltransferase